MKLSVAVDLVIHTAPDNSNATTIIGLPLDQRCRALCNRRQQLYANTSSIDRPQETGRRITNIRSFEMRVSFDAATHHIQPP